MTARRLSDCITSFGHVKEKSQVNGWRDYLDADVKFMKVHLNEVGRDHIDAIARHLLKVECAKTEEEYVRVLFSFDRPARPSLRKKAFQLATRISSELQRRGYVWRVHQVYYLATGTEFGALNKAGELGEKSFYNWSFFIYDLRPVSLLDLTGDSEVPAWGDPGI